MAVEFGIRNLKPKAGQTMYKASRQLIKDRQPFCRHKLEKVTVKQIGGGELSLCCLNADFAKDKDLNETGSKNNRMISGWLVGPHDKVKNATEISQHWWNFDSISNEYFDITPIADDTVPTMYEYVVDYEIAVYGQDIRVYDRLKSNVTKDLVLLKDRRHKIDTRSDQILDDPLTYRHFKNHPSPMCFDVAYQPLQSSTAAEFFSSAIRAK